MFFTVLQSSAPVIMNQSIGLKRYYSRGVEVLPEAWVSCAGRTVSRSPKLLPAHSSKSIFSVWVEWRSSSSISSADVIPLSRVSVVMLLSPNSSTIALWTRRVAAWKLPRGRETEWVVPLGWACLSCRSKWKRHMMMTDRLRVSPVKLCKYLCCRNLTFLALD